ncbi:MAG: DegV family EDD domain-containing protein [Clostridiales bacterium]|nr:DegV family EDD domain-containing protein [Clostridiales bacterium]
MKTKNRTEKGEEMMKKWIIVAESGSDITMEEAKRWGIEIVPMHVTMGEESRDDGSFPPEEICQFYDEKKILPKTSGSVPNDFTVVFDRIHQQNPEARILHLAYSAVTTISLDSSRVAAQGRDYVTIIDTKHVSVGQRAIVLQTLELLEREPDIDEKDLVRKVQDICDNTKMCFVPSNLVYLHAGGRCSNLALVGSQILKLHPTIEILDGHLLTTKKYRGSFGKVVQKLLRDYTEKNHLDKSRLWLIWSPYLSDEIKRLAENTAKELGFREISWIKTGCVITTHGGPGAFGIVGTVGDN